MGVRSIVSFGLFIVPVAITIAVLLGIDLSRHASGKKSIFALPPNTKITTDIFCQLGYGFTPLPGRFTCKSLHAAFSESLSQTSRCFRLPF